MWGDVSSWDVQAQAWPGFEADRCLHAMAIMTLVDWFHAFLRVSVDLPRKSIICKMTLLSTLKSIRYFAPPAISTFTRALTVRVSSDTMESAQTLE